MECRTHCEPAERRVGVLPSAERDRARRPSLLDHQHESFQGQDYTSAAVDTYQKFSFAYGKVFIRAKLPHMGQGIWPALWMLGTGCNPVGPPCPWPGPGANEIDNLEAVNTPGTMYMTPHYGSEPGTDQTTGGCSFSGVDFSAGYHDFAMVWRPGGVIDWYVDGVQRCHREAPGFFTGPMYLIFNTAIGGSWPGNPDERPHRSRSPSTSTTSGSSRPTLADGPV